MGRFDIDEEGNYIIMANGMDRAGNPRLEDLDGRRVNERGYLLDEVGRVIMRGGPWVFKAEEIDSDGEIPAPFCYMKSKQALGMGQNMFGADAAPAESAGKGRKGAESDRSVRTEDYANENQAMAPSRVVKKGTDQLVLFNPNDDDFIDKIHKPMKPLTKDQIIKQLQAKNVVPLGFPTGNRR